MVAGVQVHLHPFREWLELALTNRLHTRGLSLNSGVELSKSQKSLSEMLEALVEALPLA